LTARLIETAVPETPEAVALVLHGGASRRGDARVSPAQLSVLRMVPIAGRTARAGRGRLAVFRLLNSARGWDAHQTPLRDASWALDQIAERLGQRLPTCLIGHSLGGRAALLTSGAPEVRSAVALAPWVQPTDSPKHLGGRQILIVHGSDDRIAPPQRSVALAKALSRQAEVTYICVEGGKHAMLRRGALFDGLAAQFAVMTLLGIQSDGPLGHLGDGERFIRL
jgi:predicted esterase